MVTHRWHRPVGWMVVVIMSFVVYACTGSGVRSPESIALGDIDSGRARLETIDPVMRNRIAARLYTSADDAKRAIEASEHIAALRRKYEAGAAREASNADQIGIIKSVTTVILMGLAGLVLLGVVSSFVPIPWASSFGLGRSVLALGLMILVILVRTALIRYGGIAASVLAWILISSVAVASVIAAVVGYRWINTWQAQRHVRRLASMGEIRAATAVAAFHQNLIRDDARSSTKRKNILNAVSSRFGVNGQQATNEHPR